jgi:hypothetical protein
VSAMSTTQGKADRRYLDHLAAHLKLLDVPGERIGEILAEAEAHAAESGESLSEAFGDPKTYARQWAGCPKPSLQWRSVGTAMIGCTGGLALSLGATGLAMDQRLPLVGWPTWTLLVLGTALSVGWAAVAPLHRIRDPRTGALSGRSRTAVVLIGLLVCALIAGAGALGAALR